MKFLFLLFLLSQTSFGSKQLQIIDLDDEITAAKFFSEMREKTLLNPKDGVKKENILFSKILKPRFGMPSRAKDFNADVDLLIEEKVVVKTLDCIPLAVILKEEQQWEKGKQIERKQTIDELTKSYLSKNNNVKHLMLRRKKEESQQNHDELETCASKGVKYSNIREPNSDNGSNAEREPQTNLKKRKRKSQKNEEEFNDGKIIQLELKSEEVFGGCLLFSNIGKKIIAAPWKDGLESIIDFPKYFHFLTRKRSELANRTLNKPISLNEYKVKNLECGSNNWEFDTKHEAKQALEEYVYYRNLEIYNNLWIPTTFGSDVGEYDTKKKAEQKIRHKKNTEEKSAIKRKGPLPEQIDMKQQDDDYEGGITIESVGQVDEKETLAKNRRERELLFQEIMRKWDKDVADDENQPKKQKLHRNKYYTAEQLSLGNAKTVNRKSFVESQENEVKNKKKNRSSNNILNELDSSDEFELNQNEFKEFDLNQEDSNVDLTRIVDKGDKNITGRVLYGKHKGLQQTFSKNEVKNKTTKVKYCLSKEQERHHIEKKEKHIPKQIKRLSEMQEEIEELLFRLCYNAYDSKDCTAMMQKWRDAQAYKYDSHEFENRNLFCTKAKKIRTKLRRITHIQSYESTQENENLTEEREIQMLLLKMLWLEIKAQSLSKKFREFVTGKTREAFRGRGKNPPDESSVGVRIVYQMCTPRKKIQKLYDDVKNAYDGGTERKYAKRPLSAIFGHRRVHIMIRPVPLSDAKRLQNKIKDYMERLEREKSSDKRETRPSTFVKDGGVFATARLEKYEVVGLWNGDLYDSGVDDDVFDGSKPQQNNYVVRLWNGDLYDSGFDGTAFDGQQLKPNSLKKITEKIKIESVLDPNLLHGALNQNHFTWERKRFNLGWVRFHYEGIPLLAEVALDTIEAGKGLFTCYVETHVMNTRRMKYNDDEEVRKEIVKNVENKVKAILQNIDKSNAK